MRILIVNDDGYYAPGFEVIRKVAEALGDEVWAVGPETDQSGLAHSLTLSHPLRLTKLGERDYILRGTPTDCVIMGVRELMPEPPDLVLSGVNLGQNIGDDVTYSGTVAGAMEGALLGIKSIALSLRVNWGDEMVIHWDTVTEHAPGLIRSLLDMDFDRQMFVNVNFPDLPPDDVKGVAVVRQGSLEHSLYAEHRRDGRNKPYYWLRFSGREADANDDTDVGAIQTGKITVTPLRPDLTFDAGIERLKGVLVQE
ncbi:MAG: 5'/3'-nucleotidase SurE [Pseudomonadota bacterium]